MKTQRLSIIVPVYNEEKYIKKIFERVLRADTQGFNKEIIIVNDGSTDKTSTILTNLKKTFKSKKDKLIIINKKNEGKGSALKKGFIKSSGDIVLVQDADLEYDPDDYSKLLLPFIKHEADIVYGSRLATSEPHRVLYFWHFVVNRLLTTISNIFTNLNLTDMETCYKAFKGDIIRKLAPNLKSKKFGFEPEITAKVAKIKNIKIYEVGISYSGRTYEEGKKIIWKDGLLAMWEIIRYNLFK